MRLDSATRNRGRTRLPDEAVSCPASHLPVYLRSVPTALLRQKSRVFRAATGLRAPTELLTRSPSHAWKAPAISSRVNVRSHRPDSSTLPATLVAPRDDPPQVASHGRARLQGRHLESLPAHHPADPKVQRLADPKVHLPAVRYPVGPTAHRPAGRKDRVVLPVVHSGLRFASQHPGCLGLPDDQRRRSPAADWSDQHPDADDRPDRRSLANPPDCPRPESHPGTGAHHARRQTGRTPFPAHCARCTD